MDRNQSNVHYMMAMDGLTGSFLAAHFHLGVAGSSGGVLYTLPFNDLGSYGYWTDSSVTDFSLANALQFREDSVYVNVHTSAEADGEIRGQVMRASECFGPSVSVQYP